jgi:broad specificity phosphatase PhoE
VASPYESWPTSLWLVRHGESAGNVARDAAEAAGMPMIEVAHRDMDVPLSELGESQSRTLGDWIGRLPGGESWADVALRLRSMLDSIGRQYAGERLLVVTHQVVILVFRYLLEHLDEEQLLAIDRADDVANCSITVFDLDPALGRTGGMVLRRYNDVSPLRRAGEEVTAEPDAHVAPR